MGPGAVPLGLTDISKKVEEGAIAQGKRETQAYVEGMRAKAEATAKFHEEVQARLKAAGPLPGMPKLGPQPEMLPSTASEVIKPADNDPRRDYAPLGPSPALTQRDIQGDPQPMGGPAQGSGGPENPGGPPVPAEKPSAPAAPTRQPQAKRSYTGPLFDPPAGWSQGPKEVSIQDMLWSATQDVWLNQSSNSGDEALQRVYNDIITKASKVGVSLPSNPVLRSQARIPGSIEVPSDAFIAEWHEKVDNLIASNPRIAQALGPITREAIAGMGDQLSRDAHDKYIQMKEARGEGFWSLDTLAEFGVGMAASMNDPIQQQTLLMGGTSKTILGAAVKEAGINAMVEAMVQPGVQARQLQLGNINSWEEGVGNAVSNITLAGALGFTFGAGGKAFEKFFHKSGNTPRPEAAPEFQHAREAMDALAADMAPEDPETAALVRKAMAEAERDYATAQQLDDRLMPDEFMRAVEEADAQLRGLQEFTSRPEVLPDAPERLIDTTDDGPTPRVGETLTEDGKPVTFTQFNPRDLGVAPDEFQYKRFSGQEGVNGAIADVETWHAPSSGKVLVFERANGERIIADGHQRRSKAISIMDARGADDIQLDGYLYREKDGWTVSDLRLKGAQKNIREGRSDVLDTAQALRERPDAIDSSFPLSRSNIRQARQLARLSPDAWDLTRAGVLDPQFAALIGQVAPDRPNIHAPLARTLIEAGPDNVRQAENILSEALLDYAERDTSTQASLFGDDNLGRGVMYKERAQIMDAAYSWLRSERSVFKALVEKGDIARALGNELVDAANLTAKDQVEMAIAAVMHSRRAGVRTAVSDMVSRALDSVRREGVSPTRAGQQVAREIRTLVEEKGFRALLEAEGPRPPQPAEAGPLFDGPGSPAHVQHADMLEGDLRPEGREDPGVDLEKVATPPDPVAGLVDELKGGTGERTPDQILGDIRKLLEPKKEGAEPKPVDAAKQAEEEFKQLEQTEKALRDALLPLTDAQKVSLMRMQYPDAYAALNRLEGAELDDAIVGRVMAGDLKFARRGAAGTEITYKRFHADVLTDRQNKIIEMAQNGFSNMEIAIEIGVQTSSIKVLMNRAKKKLDKAGIPYSIEPGATGQSLDGQAPGALKAAIFEMLERDLDAAAISERLAAMGMNPPMQTIYVYTSKWRAAKAKGVKFARSYAGVPVKTPDFDGKAVLRQLLGEPSKYLPWHNNPDYRALAAAAGEVVQEVAVDTIVPGQSQIRHNFKEVAQRYGASDKDLPILVRENGVYYINDGTHRIAAQVDGGAHSVRARVIDLDAVTPGVNPAGATREDLLAQLEADFGDGASALTRLGEINILDTPPRWANPLDMGHTDANGRVNIYAANVSADQLRGLVLHEIGVHAGLEGIVGKQGKANVINQVMRRVAEGDAAAVTAFKRVPRDTDPAHVGEETLAYLIMHAPKTPWLQQIFADIRAWLYRTFPPIRDWMTLTDADLQSLAMGAVRGVIREANQAVNYGVTRAGGVVSTPQVKYARRPRGSENPTEIRGAEVSGGARQPGRADARPDAGALAGAAERGDVGAKPQSSRAVVSEPIPAAPASDGRRRWNDRISLSPEQRAERRAQFRDFVDAVEFDVEQSRGLGDFRFKGGKRTGERGAYEQLVYTLRQADDMHESRDMPPAPSSSGFKSRTMARIW